MGESALEGLGIRYSVAHQMPDKSSAKDTIASCRSFIGKGADLLLFCGGDGTARDVASGSEEALNCTQITKSQKQSMQQAPVPILGIPAGVKMHSGVFAISPEAAAELALGYARGDLLARETEIVDVDEERYRSGELQTRLYAIARTPYKPALVQERKRIYESANEEEFKDQIAIFAREFMRDGSAYILGAGTTTGRIAKLLGLEKTLLGVDVIQDGKVIIRDASESDLLGLMDKEKREDKRVKVIVSPIGAQGFIFGRGSQQISASVLKGVGAENLIIVSTPHKLAELSRLLIYTGDRELDRTLSGRLLVVTGYRMAQRKEVRAASDIAVG